MIPPMTIQGLNLPNRERVLSTKNPIIGSFTASNTRRIVMAPVIHHIVESGKLRISVKKNKRYMLTIV
jgi:hypothetical protein